MSDRKPTATLGGKPLLASSAVQWMLREGMKPNIETFDMIPEDARAIAGTGPVELVIDAGDGNPVRVKGLSILNISPGENPFISKVTVADRRWRWSYLHILRRYNMRRTIGIKRILNNRDIDASFQTSDLVIYWPWSMRNGVSPWTAYDALVDVLQNLQSFERDNGVSPFTYTIDQRLANVLRPLPFEEVQLDDAGDAAITRLLAKYQESALYIDYDGNVVIYSKASGGEEAVIKAVLPEIQNRGHVDLVKNNLIRPRKIEVLFTREVEVRFNFVEVQYARTISTRTVTDAGWLWNTDKREMDNVFPIPDYSLNVNGVTMPQGTWITVDEGFITYNAIPVRGGSIPFDHDLIQQAFIPQMDLWSILQIAGDAADPAKPAQNWIGRIAAYQSHYRQTFRINPRWMDRILTLRPYRLATVDPQSGQRGPALAYGDYCILPTQRAIWRRSGQAEMVWAINRSAYQETLNENAEPSPAVIEILDNDQGIVRVNYLLDPLRLREMILPSLMITERMPTGDLKKRTGQGITFDSIVSGSKPPALSPSFKLAVILSVIPASPNTSAQLHKITVNPDDVRDLMPNVAAAKLDECDGPVMQIRIGANVEVARIRWLDSKSSEIEKIFGLPEGVQGEPNLTDLVLNGDNATDIRKGASLSRIAKASAASYYASLIDRYEGGMSGYLNGRVKPDGWVDSIIHRLDIGGEATTSVQMAQDIPQFDLMAFLDSSSRAAILHPVTERI